MTHIVFDSYTELTIKDGEQNHKSSDHSTIDLAIVAEFVPWHQVSTTRIYNCWYGMWANEIS